jgi:ribosome-binding protein aMBF1 (putative translation factor)
MSKLPNETCPRCGGWVWHRTEPCNCKPSHVPSPKDEPSYLELVGKRIRTTRESKGLSMNDLAAKARIGKTGLWQIERGRSEPMARTIVSLANALDVTTDFLLLRGTVE